MSKLSIRDLPLRLGTPMLVVRGGYKNGIEEDLFKPKQQARR